MSEAYVIVNPRSGALLETDRSALAARLRNAFARTGLGAKIVFAQGPQLQQETRLAGATARGPIFVLGGDGTILSAAEVLAGRGKPLGILPGGTVNLLARELGIPLDPEEAVVALARAKPVAIDMGEVNGRPFICCSIIGLLPEVAHEREQHRGRLWIHRLPALALAALRAVTRYPPLEVEVQAEGERRRLRTRSLAVTVNPLVTPLGGPPQRERLDMGRLMLYASLHSSRWDMARLAVQVALGSWREYEDLETLVGESFTILTRYRRRIRVMNDGELAILATPLHYRVRPGVLEVLAPVVDSTA